METRERVPDRAWYVIHTYSGYENKVKMNLEKKIESQGLQNEIFNVVVPLEDEVELKDGKERIVKRKVFPGYVLVDMIVNNRSWYVVRNTQGVTGFVGTEKDPVPLDDAEAKRILEACGEPFRRTRRRFEVGSRVVVIDGWFKDKEGEVEEIDDEKSRLKVKLADGTNLDLNYAAVKPL